MRIHPGATCPEHKEWFDLTVGQMDAGNPAAIELACELDPGGLHPEKYWELVDASIGKDPVQGELF